MLETFTSTVVAQVQSLVTSHLVDSICQVRTQKRADQIIYNFICKAKQHQKRYNINARADTLENVSADYIRGGISMSVSEKVIVQTDKFGANNYHPLPIVISECRRGLGKRSRG